MNLLTNNSDMYTSDPVSMSASPLSILSLILNKFYYAVLSDQLLKLSISLTFSASLSSLAPTSDESSSALGFLSNFWSASFFYFPFLYFPYFRMFVFFSFLLFFFCLFGEHCCHHTFLKSIAASIHPEKHWSFLTLFVGVILRHKAFKRTN